MKHDLTKNPKNSNESYGWHFQYLTIIGLTIAFLTFISGLLYVHPSIPIYISLYASGGDLQKRSGRGGTADLMAWYGMAWLGV